jgi:predicted Zn-dependent peptidase
VIDRADMPSAEIMIGRPAVPVGDEEFTTLMLLDYILGGSVGSRLHKNLMLNKSLVTSVRSGIEWSRGPGIFSIYCTTPAETVAEAVETILSTIREMRDIRPSVKELEEAKRFFRGHIPAILETRSDIVSQFAGMYMYGVTPEFYSKMLDEFDRIDPLRLHRLAQRMLDENGFTIIVSGPERQLRRDLSHIAPIEEYYSGSE